MVNDVQKGCPESPPPRTTVYTRTLHRACEVAGGVPQLAAQLKVSPLALQRWLEGAEPPPVEVFLACADIALSPAAQRLLQRKMQ
jgi:hypothetical protein